MHQVKVFNAAGTLQKVISAEQVREISNKKFEAESGTVGGKRKLRFKNYPCAECRTKFRSRSTRGAIYCPKCRKKAYKRNRKKDNAPNK